MVQSEYTGLRAQIHLRIVDGMVQKILAVIHLVRANDAAHYRVSEFLAAVDLVGSCFIFIGAAAALLSHYKF